MSDLQSLKGKAVKSWDPWAMFDVSEKEMEVAKKRKALLTQKKIEFKRIRNNPADLVNGGRGGHLLDPGIQRWDSARNTMGTYFRVNRRNTGLFFTWYLIPIGFTYAITMYQMTKMDEKNRKGEVPMTEKCKKAFLFL